MTPTLPSMLFRAIVERVRTWLLVRKLRRRYLEAKAKGEIRVEGTKIETSKRYG